MYKGSFAVDFFAEDRVMNTESLKPVYHTIYAQNQLCFVGINATGKTTALRLINLAARVVIDNISLNEASITQYGIISDGTEMIVIFAMNDSLYQLDSRFTVLKDRTKERAGFSYKEEVLLKKPLKTITRKKDLLNFSDSGVTERIVRSQLSREARAVLKPDDSIAILATRENDCVVQDVLTENYVNYSPMSGETPQPVLNAFDDSIEYLKTVSSEDGNIRWTLKFVNDDRVFVLDNPVEMNRIISAGTIKGQTLIGLAISVLRSGGYLIVDELENHFNKEMVHTIMDLFNCDKSNPNGACLIFTTHYAELLEFMDRKDNIYLTRKKDGKLSVDKFSHEFTRNDIKKSDIIISNYLKGIAPKYRQIANLRTYVCSQIKSK